MTVRPIRTLGLALLAALLVGLLLAALAAPAARAQVSGVGVGLLAVDGTTAESFVLPSGGTYFLTVATDGPSDFVSARLTYNGSLAAEVNDSLSASTFVSLAPGNYSLTLAGHGRAALGWDFTNGNVQDFPDNESLVAYLQPSGPRLEVTLSLGNAQSIDLHVYDSGLVAAGNATVTASGPVTFVLPPSRAGLAYLVATVVSGAPGGVYGLAWSAAPLNPPLDLTAWPYFLLWILVPVAVTFVVFVLLHRRAARR